MDDLDFLESYWSRATSIGDKIMMELPLVEVRHKKVTDRISIIQYKDLDNWKPVISNKSDSLLALADKIRTMIHKGRAKDVKPMVLKIISGRVKKLSKPISTNQRHMNKNKSWGTYCGEFLGYGHFRWNYRGYRLNEIELKRLKEYFGL